MTSSLIELRSPPTAPTAPPAPARKPRSRGWHWAAAIVAVLGLATAFTWGAVGTITALDRVDSYDRTAVPGQVTVSVTDPGPMVVYYENPAELARYADPPPPAAPRFPTTRPPTPPPRCAMWPPPQPGSSSGSR